MAVQILKITTSYPKTSRIESIKTKVVKVVETFKEAFEIVGKLNQQNTNTNIEYKTSQSNLF